MTFDLIHLFFRINNNLFSQNGDMEKYSTVRNLILPLIEKYQLLKSGKLTTSELKKLRIDIIDTIDLGNK